MKWGLLGSYAAPPVALSNHRYQQGH